MYLRASSEIIPVSTWNLPWISWELKVNVVPNKIKRKCQIQGHGRIQVFAEVIPKYLVIYGEVCSEDLLLLQGYLDHKMIYSVFR